MDFVWASFANSLVLGLSIGSIWLIAALGLTIIYGTAGVINMAHGEFIMLGAYSAYCLQAFFGVPFLLCLPLSFLIVGLIGLIIERVLVRYLYARPLDTLLATWGVSLVLMQGVRIIFGSEPKYIRMPEFLSSNLTVGPLSLSSFRMFLIAGAVLLVVGLWYLFYRTHFGIKIRAVTQNKEMAASFGINSSRMKGGTGFISGSCDCICMVIAVQYAARPKEMPWPRFRMPPIPQQRLIDIASSP